MERRSLLSATITVADITTESTSHAVTVAYSDPQGIDTATIDSGDLTVGGPHSVSVSLVSTSGSGTDVNATYSLTGPGGSWDSADNGTYTVTVDAAAVKDSAGNNMDAGDSKSFNVNVAAAPSDTTAPTADISVNDLTTGGGATHTVSITYTDASGINAGSIDVGDIVVSRNGGSGGGQLNVTNVAVSGSGNSRTAVYTFAAPGGTWDTADNGDYTVAVNAGAVQDASPNANGNAAASATFTVNIAASPTDTTAPSASISVADVTTAGGNTHTVTVTYHDETAMDASSISASDLQVTRNGGGAGLTVSNATATTSGDGKTVTATYTLAAPGGSFDAADNGTYTVTLRANEARDAAGNAAATSSASFAVNIGPGSGGPDTTAPTAAISAGDVTTAGGATQIITVVYTDDTAIDVMTIGDNDITITEPSGAAAMNVTAFSNAVSADGKTVTTTYTVSAPGGAFDIVDNGTYGVSLNADAVRDSAGNPAAPASASFNVRIVGAPTPGSGPSASVSAADITAPGGATQTVTVVYADDGKIRANSIGVDDIVVTAAAGGSPLQVTGVTTTTADAGHQITATYTVSAPGGTWDTADNGSYTVTVAAGAVSDTQGNASAAATGTFNVSATVVDTAPPVVASITAPDVTAAGVAVQVVTVTYTDDAGIDLSTIGTDDVTVAGPGGAAALAVNTINIAGGADAKTVTVSYTFAAAGGAFSTAENGAYTVTVNADAVRDTAGKGVAAASGAFTVAVPQPPVLDPAFGGPEGQGRVNTNFAGESAATAGTDDAFLVAGRSGNSAVIERHNPDGTLDTRFGSGGQVVSTTDNAYFAVLAQGDKVVVAGTAGGDFVLARYNADGSLDTTFGSGGRAIVDFGQANDVAYALTVDAQGRLIAVGQSNGDFAIARFTADGLPDATFNSGGKGTIDIGNAGATDLAASVLVQPDGKIVVAGPSGSNIAVVRLSDNGTLDTSFSGDGQTTVTGLVASSDPANPELGIGLALQADGKILVANHTTGGDFGIVRLDTDGSPDSSFGTGGLATADFGGEDDADAIILQPTGEIAVAGTSSSGGLGLTTLAAFDTSGTLINAFATGGKLTLDLPTPTTTPGSDSARELRIGDLVLRAFGTRLADGRIILGSSRRTAQTSQSTLRRVNAPGVRSAPNGVQIGTFGPVEDGVVQKLVYTDGDGTKITFMIRGGTGTAFLGADNRINLVLTETAGGSGCIVSVKGKGGDGRIAFGDITTLGSVKSLSVKNGDLAGTFAATGSVGRLVLGNVTGNAIASGGNIGSVAVTSLSNTKVMAGANLGADGEFGGTGDNADSYGAASIGTLKVSGQITASTIAAGLDPVDTTFFDEDDVIVGGETSFIKSISAAGADNASRFIAGKFGKAKLGTKVNIATDPRFRTV